MVREPKVPLQTLLKRENLCKKNKKSNKKVPRDFFIVRRENLCKKNKKSNKKVPRDFFIVRRDHKA
jgi:hypothetical protein